MFYKQPYRALDRTLVIDTRVREVSQHQNSVIRSQTHAVGIPLNENHQSISIVVGPKGYALPATKGFIHIDTGNPLKMQIGNVFSEIQGQFTLTGSLPEIVLISETEQRVQVIQY